MIASGGRLVARELSNQTSGSRRRRLLWVNHFASSPVRGRGLRHFEIGRELTGLGWDVTIVTAQKAGTGAGERGYGVGSVEAERIDSVHFRWLGVVEFTENNWRRGLNWLSFARVFDRWSRNEGRADIIIGSSPHLFAALAAERHARRIGVPFVFEVRDLWPESLLAAGGHKGLLYHLLNGIAKYLYRRAERVVVLAEGSVDYLVRAGVPRSKLVLVPNGVDADRFPERDESRQKTFTIVYAGAHGPANGLDAVLDAAQLLKDRSYIQFRLIGSGTSKTLLEEDARRRGLSNVRFEDQVSGSEIPRVLSEADAGLMVLRDSPLFSFAVSPNKLFDYFAAGLPVICNVPGEVSDLLRRANAGVQARDPSGRALADAVLRLVGLTVAERAELGASGRQWVRRERSRVALATRLNDTLADCLAQAARQ